MLVKTIDGGNNWANKVRRMLRENNLESFWESKKVQSESPFMAWWKDTLLNRLRKHWFKDMLKVKDMRFTCRELSVTF